MERLYGVTLREELKGAGYLQPVEAAEMFDQVLEGIKAAHGQGVVHRDLKPENILIARVDERSMVVRLLDFGLAQLRALDSAATATVSIAGQVMGTLDYMAPEQLMGARVDERTDIFALGVMLVEVLTRKRPFNRSTYGGVPSLHLEEFHLSGATPVIRSLDVVLQRCLARDPNSRFASAAELQRELLPVLRACPPLNVDTGHSV